MCEFMESHILFVTHEKHYASGKMYSKNDVVDEGKDELIRTALEKKK